MSDTLVVHVHFGSDFIQIRANGAVEKVPVEAAARTAVITTAQTTIKEYYLSKSSGSFFDQGRLIALGRSLFDFLDTTSVVTRILDDAERKGCKTLVFEYSGADDLRELPWELLAAEAYLAEAVNPLYSPVRLLWADERAHTRNPSPPAPRDLSVLLLAASPEGVEPVLSYEDEETRIERSVAQKRLELVTEESGSLLGLRERLHSRVDGAWDVVHITCHGTLHPKPSLILEDEEGGPDVVDAQRFATDGLAGRVPRLCFVSACHSAESEPTGGLPSLAQVLTRAGVDHVIGWASTVFDTAATDFATRLYEELSSAAPVERAIALARFEVIRRASQTSGDWFLARAYLRPSGGSPLVTDVAGRRPAPRRAVVNVFLDAARKEVPVAGPDQFVGRRREVQRAIRAMRPASEKKGVVFFGQGGWGKSSTALRVIQRLEAIDGTNTVIVLHQAFDADTILDRVHDALIRLPAATKEIVEIRRQISDGGNAEEALFSGLTRLLNLDDLRNRPVVFVLDDFEWALDRTEPRDRFQPLHPLVAPLRGLVQAVRHAPAAKMIVTTRYRFQLPDRNGYDLFDGFEEIPLRPFGEDEMMRAVRRRMQPDALQRLEEKSVRGKELRTAVTRCMGACFGNPRLLGLLVDVAVADVSKASALIDRMESDQKAIVTAEADSAGGSAEFNEVLEFYRRLALTELLSLAGADTQALLRAATVFFLPVPAEVFMAAAPNGVDAPRAVERATSNGLLEVFRHRDGKLSYRVPDIVRLLLKPLKKDEEVQVSNACVDMLFDSWGGINNFDSIQCSQLLSLAFAAKAARAIVHSAAIVATSLIARGDARQGAALVEKALTFGESARLHHAAARAFDTVSPEKSITHYARAMELIGQVTDSSDDRTKREFAAIAANLAQARIRVGEIDAARMLLIDTAAPIFERFGDVRGLAVTKGQIADILQARGDLDEALRIRREEEIPVYERLGDVHSLAVTKGQIADILQARGELDEALRIRREEQIPVYERLGDVRELAVTKGKIADILQARGDLDEALRIRREEQIPVYERLGDVRALAVTKGKIADILQARGDLDEALRIRRDEQIPVFERLGDLRELAIAKAMCAQVLVAQDEGDQIVPAMREFAEAVMLLAQCQAYPELAKVAIDAAQIAAKGGHHREVQRASAAGAWASLLLNESSQAGQFLAYFSMASIHRGAPFPKILLDAAVAAVGLTENDDVKKQLAPIVGAAAQAVGIADEDFPKWLEEHNKRLDTEGFINMVAPGLLDAINQPLPEVEEPTGHESEKEGESGDGA